MKSNKALFMVTILALMSLVAGACVPITPVAPGTPGTKATPQATEEAAEEATAAPSEEGAELTLEGVTWLLIGYVDANGAEATPAVDSTIQFQDGQVSGSGGCNNYSGSYTLDGDQLTIGPVASTMMACIGPAMDQEQAFHANLGNVASFEIVDNQLHLLDAGGATLLTFEQQVTPSLTGVVWQAISYNNGKQAVVTLLEGTTITAEFGEDGQLSGTAGCNSYTAGYTAEDGAISIQPAASTRMMCGAPDGVHGARVSLSCGVGNSRHLHHPRRYAGIAHGG